MNNPTLDKLMTKSDSRYTLAVVVAKRARELTEIINKETGMKTRKAVTVAFQEIADGKIGFERVKLGIK